MEHVGSWNLPKDPKQYLERGEYVFFDLNTTNINKLKLGTTLNITKINQSINQVEHTNFGDEVEIFWKTLQK
jgi:hypothetical protein